MDLTAVLVLLVIFGSIYGIIQLFVRRKERMALIEKGVDASKLNYFKKQTTASSLKYGLLLIGIAVGLLLGDVLSVTTELQQEVAYFSMVFIFGGLALVIFHFIDKKKREEEGD
ncbi:MAG: hypothetical protein K8S00_02125 [Bacteroidales bacterium]|nr:hypothetical protein [Bacteroidales bacterium]